MEAFSIPGADRYLRKASPEPAVGHQRSADGEHLLLTAGELVAADAIRVRGVVEGFAARLLAEDGASRQLLRELHECLEARDKAVNKPAMDLEDYTAYVEMNDRFHKLIMQGCGNVALQRVMEMLDRQPFASPSAMLPAELMPGLRLVGKVRG